MLWTEWKRGVGQDHRPNRDGQVARAQQTAATGNNRDIEIYRITVRNCIPACDRLVQGLTGGQGLNNMVFHFDAHSQFLTQLAQIAFQLIQIQRMIRGVILVVELDRNL